MFRSTTTLENSTGNGLSETEYSPSTSSPEDSRVNHLALQAEEEEWQTIYQESLSGLLGKRSPDISLEKMSEEELLEMLENNSGLSDMERQYIVIGLMTMGLTISDIAGGPLHTPTTKANFQAESMQKWPSCRRYRILFGQRKIWPELFEYLMGFPIGWTDLKR